MQYLKKIILLTVSIALMAQASWGNHLVVKQKYKTSPFYFYGKNIDASSMELELWIGTNRLALVSKNRKIIVDGVKKRMLVLNLKAKTYVETPLDLDLPKWVDPPDREYIVIQQLEGSIEKTGKTRDIEGLKCTGYAMKTHQTATSKYPRAYDIEYWLAGKGRLGAKETLFLYSKLMQMEFFNSSIISPLLKMGGIPIASKIVLYRQYGEVNQSAETVEITEKKAPEGFYSPPPDFKRKKLFSYGDVVSR